MVNPSDIMGRMHRVIAARVAFVHRLVRTLRVEVVQVLVDDVP
jgi:hypothetical protein